MRSPPYRPIANYQTVQVRQWSRLELHFDSLEMGEASRDGRCDFDSNNRRWRGSYLAHCAVAGDP